MDKTMQHEDVRELFCRRERRSERAAREFAREALTAWEWGAGAGDVTLCVSELAANALVHGVPPGRGYLLRMWLYEQGCALRVEVHDSGYGRPRVRRPEGESGRGLLLVDALADRWGVGPREPGKVVWCEFERHRPFASIPRPSPSAPVKEP
ncbi:ATP-binding protein [Streptomyces peucetius]|uniref:ATP-binding protein n=1 Tax=Streptomyces peucetius TaxID=1950 RepID=A0ABY6ICT4_STRPE|nr:ATP-binding protein [Streptomyces peucetius]UYQ63662.1 ATP-binding protein [Streptomyces peucetius]